MKKLSEKNQKSQKMELHRIKQSGFRNYPLGDFLIKIKNAVMANSKEVDYPEIKAVLALADVLKKAGFLEDVYTKDGKIVAKIAFQSKAPVMFGLKLISRPGLRIYRNVAEIETKKGPSILLLATSRGVLTSTDCVRERVGGEVIAEIW